MKGQEIQVNDIWNDDKQGELKQFILLHSEKQSKERKLTNQLLSIQYKIEDYIRNDNENEEILKVLDFVKMYLKTLDITQKKLADLFEMKDSNLHKYLVGERKLNPKLVLKLSHFSHTKPEYWIRIQVKNELIELKKENKNTGYYEKYDYRNLISV
jgi:plasmid maintenance system antidote protein VapI